MWTYSRVGYALFSLQGVGMLFPYNAFITCTGYYKTAFAGTPYAQSAVGLFVLAFTVLGVAGLLAGVVFESLSLRVRVVVPLVGQLALFIAIAALTPVPVLSPDCLFAVMLGCACASALFSASLQGGVLAFSSTLPPIYTNGVMVGQALSGLVVALANFAILLAQHESAAAGSGGAAPRDAAAEQATTQRRAAFAYYLVSAGVMAACVAGYYYLVALFASGRLGAQMRGALDACADDAEAEAVAAGFGAGGGGGGRAPGGTGPARLLRNPLGDSDAPEFAEDDGPAGRALGSPAARWRAPPSAAPRAGLWRRAVGGGEGSGAAHAVPTAEQAPAQDASTLAPRAEAAGSREAGALAVAAPADAELGRRDEELGGAEGGGAFTAAPEGTPDAAEAHGARAGPGMGPRAPLRARARALSRIRFDALSLLLTFAVTLAVFPSVTSLIQPRGLPLWPSHAASLPTAARALRGLNGALGRPEPSLYAALFVPCLFVLFNLGDVLGRALAAVRPVRGARALLALSAARLAFVPLMLACAIASRAGAPGAPLGALGGGEGLALAGGPAAAYVAQTVRDGLAWSDAPALALLLLLGVSNGFCASCTFMAAPLRVERAEMEWVGRTMPLFLNVGLTVGSLLALLLERAVG